MIVIDLTIVISISYFIYVTFFNKEGQSQLPREVDVPGLGRPAKESLYINLERYFKNIDAYIYIYIYLRNHI